MLKGIVLDYYYLNISTNKVTINFDLVCNFINNYFEKAKYNQNVYSKQNKLTLKSVIGKNNGKSMEKHLKKLINKF